MLPGLPQVLPSDQIQKGFGALESLDDLLLDVPDAVELLSLFIARGVVSLLAQQAEGALYDSHFLDKNVKICMSKARP